MQELARKIHELDANAVVVGMGLTQGAESVRVVMDQPPYSKGDVVYDINDLPVVVAKHLVLEAVKLIPAKSLDQAQSIITQIINKFSK